MNKREEEAKIFIKCCLNDIISICDPSDEYIEGYTHGIMEGVRWSDEHPNWINIEDELPSIDEFGYSNYLLIVIDSDIITVGYYCNNNKRWYLHDDSFIPKNHKVTHWMSFPKFNNKKD